MLQLTKEHVDAGFMTVDGLCAAAIVWSDNTAARTARRSIGWTRYVRSLGDTISRLDRTEPDLNTAIAGDPRTTTQTRLHADLPNGWSVGDKSGSGDHGTRNDVGIIKPPRGPPILATIYCTESAEPLSSREQVIAEVSQITASAADARMQTGSTHSRRNDTVSIT
jgi:beta-lactamase class A